MASLTGTQSASQPVRRQHWIMALQTQSPLRRTRECRRLRPGAEEQLPTEPFSAIRAQLAAIRAPAADAAA